MGKETSIKLHFYVEGALSEEEAHSMIADMVSDYQEIYGVQVEYQISGKISEKEYLLDQIRILVEHILDTE